MKERIKEIWKKIGVITSFVLSTILLLGIVFFAAIGMSCIQLFVKGVIVFVK